MSAQGLRIAWFSELVSAGSVGLSAYCSNLLLPRISTQHTIEVFSPYPACEAYGLPHHHFLNAYRRHREEPFDLFFYQLEDSRSCRFVRGHIGLMPGITWFHDLFFNDLGPEACHTSPWETSIAQFYKPSEPFYDRAKAPHQLWPRAYREVSLSPVVLFSSQWARNEFGNMVSNRLESVVGSHQADVLPVPVGGEISRREPSAAVFTIASTSVPGIEGRSHKLLPVLRSLRFDWQLLWMVEAHEHAAAVRVVNEFGVADRVTLVTPRSLDAWERIVAESDVALHLHTSPFGHLAPFVQTSLCAGTPTVVSFAAQGEDFPANTVFQIVPGIHEGAQLEGVFDGIVRGGRAAYGTEGQRYILNRSNADRVAERLAEGFVEWAPHVGFVMDKWGRLGQRGKQALFDEVMGLVEGDRISGISPVELLLKPAFAAL